jgi:hypothetical protein
MLGILIIDGVACMKLLNACLVAILISGIAFAGALQFGPAQNGTNVTGPISKDTTWTPANSPYTLTGTVTVNTSVTLTIEAGAVIYFGNGNNIEVNGTLVAIGTNVNNIQFTNGTITFTPASTGWNELANSGSIIQYADFEGCQVNVLSPAKIDHDTFVGGRPNYDVDAICGVISNNTMTGFYDSGIYCSGNASVLDNTIIGGNTGGISISLGSPLIQGNLVTNNLGEDSGQNGGGIYIGSTAAAPIIENNALTDNVIGIAIGFQEGAGRVEPNIFNNNIYNNQQYNFELNGIGYNVSAINNWWGTTDTKAINQTIYDFKDNSSLGNVSFVPFLDSPNTQAPTFVNATAGADGSISPSGIISLNYGSSQTFTITPNTGYYVVNVLVNGTSVGAVSSYTVKNIQGATNISATFAINTYSLTVNVGSDGSSNIASQTVDFGSVENFEFTPDTGYSVADVVVNGTIGEGAVTSLSTTITGPTTVSVNFSINTYTITITQSANGQIAPGTTTVNYGANQNFTLTPNNGYYIASITEDSGPLMVTSPSGQSVNFTHVTAAHTLTATFVANPTPTPSSTLAPTTSPTATPAPISTPTPAPTATPNKLPSTSTQNPISIYEILIATLVILIIAFVVVIAAFRREKRR